MYDDLSSGRARADLDPEGLDVDNDVKGYLDGLAEKTPKRGHLAGVHHQFLYDDPCCRGVVYDFDLVASASAPTDGARL